MTMTLAQVETASEAIVSSTLMEDVDAALKSETDSVPEPTEKKGLKVLFLSSDTGGGHRASAESLARQFQLLYPGSTYDLLDVVEKDGAVQVFFLEIAAQCFLARAARGGVESGGRS